MTTILLAVGILVLAAFIVALAHELDRHAETIDLLDRALGPVEPSRGTHGLREVKR